MTDYNTRRDRVCGILEAGLYTNVGGLSVARESSRRLEGSPGVCAPDSGYGLLVLEALPGDAREIFRS